MLGALEAAAAAAVCRGGGTCRSTPGAGITYSSHHGSWSGLSLHLFALALKPGDKILESIWH